MLTFSCIFFYNNVKLSHFPNDFIYRKEADILLTCQNCTRTLQRQTYKKNKAKTRTLQTNIFQDNKYIIADVSIIFIEQRRNADTDSAGILKIRYHCILMIIMYKKFLELDYMGSCALYV